MHWENIPVPEYEKLTTQFNPVDFNADEWVNLAADAGQPVAQRVEATRSLALASFEEAGEVLEELLSSQHPQAVQTAAIRTLSRFRGTIYIGSPCESQSISMVYSVPVSNSCETIPSMFTGCSVTSTPAPPRPNRGFTRGYSCSRLV